MLILYISTESDVIRVRESSKLLATVDHYDHYLLMKIISATNVPISVKLQLIATNHWTPEPMTFNRDVKNQTAAFIYAFYTVSVLDVIFLSGFSLFLIPKMKKDAEQLHISL